MAGKFVEHFYFRTLAKRKFSCPRLAVDCRIDHCELIIYLLLTAAGKTFDNDKIRTRSIMILLRMQISRLNYQGVVFPMANRIAHPLIHYRRMVFVL